ncbi:layilin isoform X6 [Myotis lucifugus]|uniref:layilin isoform X6 n=1 Tax=Myotis lucifugus TaxID=59463 RepID=UPI000CCC8CF1|nr:layilin isoform X6 [Myotis lucifugus]
MTPKERRYKTLYNWLLIETFSTKAMKEEIGNKKSQPSGFVCQPVCRGGTQRPCYKVLYFHDASRRLNFEEARAACRRDGGQLVSIESEDEQRLIEKFIENLLASDGDFWIGLRRREEKQSNSTACQDLYTWMDGSISTFRNWYVDEPSCGSEVCVVMYHQPSAPIGIGGPYMFQWNDDRCNMKNNFICKYSDEEPTVPSTGLGGERTKAATPILPENTEKEDVKETFKENKAPSSLRERKDKKREYLSTGKKINCLEPCLPPSARHPPLPPPAGHHSCLLGLDLEEEDTGAARPQHEGAAHHLALARPRAQPGPGGLQRHPETKRS